MCAWIGSVLMEHGACDERDGKHRKNELHEPTALGKARRVVETLSREYRRRDDADDHAKASNFRLELQAEEEPVRDDNRADDETRINSESAGESSDLNSLRDPSGSRASVRVISDRPGQLFGLQLFDAHLTKVKPAECVACSRLFNESSRL